MQTALHIRALVEQLRAEIIGGQIVATEFYRKERSAYLFIKKGKSRLALGMIYHPHGYGTFLVPASKIKVTTREKPWPIFKLEKAVIIGIEQPILDRIFSIDVHIDDTRSSILFESLGANANLWWLDENMHPLGTLRKREYDTKKNFQSPPPPNGIDPATITSEQVEQLVNEYGSLFSSVLQKKIIGFNRTLFRELNRRIEAGDSAENWKLIAKSIREMAVRFTADANGLLYSIGGRPEVYPLKLSSIDDPPEKYKTLSLAVMQLCSLRQSQISAVDERKTVLGAISRGIKKLNRRLEKLQEDIESATDFEKQKRIGELLQVNYDKINKRMEKITVHDLITDSEIAIKLNPALSPSENIEAYFKKYRKGREGLELLKRRLQVTKNELETLQKIQTDLEHNFETAYEQHKLEIATLLPSAGSSNQNSVRLPYRQFTLSSGITVFVGRDGSDNDRTTFEFARPYELWFHAQQCPGSHVVMKYPNKSFEPSKQEIEETASLAARYSKARNNSLVPVIYTQRKYVRKPRKAKAGLVSVEREKSVMVPPATDEPDAKE